MTTRIMFTGPLLMAVMLGLTACGPNNVESTDPSLKPFVTVAPSGAEVVCEWSLQANSRYTGEWDCEVVK